MAEFFKPVEVERAGKVQSRDPSGPSKNEQAHRDASESVGGFAGAIMSLLGTGTAVLNTMNKETESDRIRAEKKFGLNADSDTSDYASYGRNFLSNKALEAGRSVEDYTKEDIEKTMSEVKKSYIESKGLDKKEYFSLIDKRLNDKGILLTDAQNRMNVDIKDKKNIATLHQSVAENFKKLDAASLSSYIDDALKTHVGPDAAINKTVEEVKGSLLSPLMTTAIENKDPALLEKLKSKEMKELFDVPDYDNVINGVEQQVRSTINQRKNMNYSQVEEEGYMLAENGFFKSTTDVDNYLKSKQFKKGYEPNSKDMIKLRSNLYDVVGTELNYEAFSSAMKSGDFTFADRKAMQKKDKDALGNKLFKVETGIQDTSPNGLTDALNSGMIDENIKQYAMNGLPFPADLESWANTPPTGGVEGLRKKFTAFSQLNTLTQDTPSPITSVFKAKEFGRMMYVGELLGRLDDGVLDQKQFQDAYSVYSNDLDQNVDSYGVYTSPNAAPYTKDKEVQKWLDSTSKDAPWTWDDNTSAAYTKRQLTNNLNILIDSGLSLDDAKEKASEMFEQSHLRFENADGTEGVMPTEFKSVIPESLTEVAMNLPQLRVQREADKLFGSEWNFKRKISVRPAANYEKTKQIEVYYDGRPVQNTFMNRATFDSNWNKLETKEAKKIRQDYEDRLTKLKHEQELIEKEGIWRYRTN